MNPTAVPDRQVVAAQALPIHSSNTGPFLHQPLVMASHANGQLMMWMAPPDQLCRSPHQRTDKFLQWNTAANTWQPVGHPTVSLPPIQ